MLRLTTLSCGFDSSFLQEFRSRLQILTAKTWPESKDISFFHPKVVQALRKYERINFRVSVIIVFDGSLELNC